MTGTAAARGNGVDDVYSKTGTKKNCRRPRMTKTDQCSPDVFINGVGAVREGDRVALHPAQGCGPDLSVLTKGSSTVFVNGKAAGRIGSQYTGDNTITTGSKNVFIGY
jgi:uncharacterized Zn-binding protein involved in type VI secretion